MIVRYRNPMLRAQDLFDRFFESAWRDFDNMASNYQGATFSIPLDVYENDEAFVVAAVLPGVNEEQLEVRMHDDTLTITAETAVENVSEGVRVLLRERDYGNFSRSIRLPGTVDANAIETKYENGILSVLLPKSEEARPRVIPVRVNGAKK